MERELEKYLEKATASIPDKEDAKMVRFELEDHILTKAELLCLSGCSFSNAIMEVLAAMGDADKLSEDLGEVHSQPGIKGKVIYEYEGSQCRYLAQRIGKSLKIPYEAVSNHPPVYDCELLIIVKKGIYGGGAGKDLIRYIQQLKKGNLKAVIFVQNSFGFSAARSVNLNRSYVGEINSASERCRGKDGQILQKILMDKGIESIESRICLRSMKLLGKVSEGEVTKVITYLKKITGTYGE